MLGIVLGNAFLLVLYCYVVMPPPAQAYFDLGTGAYLIQLVFGVGAAFFLSFKSQVVRKLGWAKKPKAVDVPPKTEETTEEPA